MSFNPAGLTGIAITGLTSPTYTVTADVNSGLDKSWVVTALGGTQTGVVLHSNSNPFSIKVQKARSVKSAPSIATNGAIKGGGYNVFKISLIKGAVPLAGQSPQTMIIDLNIRVPGGADISDANSLAAAISCFTAFLNNQTQAVYDMVKSNVV